MGTFINSYLINIAIVLFYIMSYLRLSQHYKSLQFRFANYISSYEIDQMNDTLYKLAINFSAISQCFLYRIFQRVMADLYREQLIVEDTGKVSTFYSVIICIFYLSETIMMVGICISIRQSVITANEEKRNSTAGVSGI